MKALFLTNEFPPTIYGGAGVHVDYLTRELSQLMQVEVRCFGKELREARVRDERLEATGFGVDQSGYGAPAHLRGVFGALQRCLDWNSAGIDADVVHLHTWYTHLGGILAKLNYGKPLVLTVHSLEPLRPWKREQIGGGYDFSCWVERTAIEMADAVVAVSSETRDDILRLFQVDPSRVKVIYNGIDPSEYRRVESRGALRKFGVDESRPYVLFVGRVTRQKGIVHLARAIRHMSRDFQVVLCAGAPDTPEIAAEMRAAVEEAQSVHGGVLWLQEMVSRPEAIELYSHASVFCCPSVYEPFGIINLEAMACETPVVASAVGGIKEVVVEGETGFLVPVEIDAARQFEPVDPEGFARGLADRVNRLMGDEPLRIRMAAAGRARVEERFTWKRIAEQTRDLYRSLLS
jgi:glycogen synthase